MSSVRNAAGALVAIKGISVRDASNVLRAAPAAVIRDAGNVLRSFFTSITAAASPNVVSGAVSSSTAAAATTDNTKATPTGGIAPFNYLWSAISGTGWTIGSATAATTSFTSPAVAAGSTVVATFSCKITDSSGATAVTDIVEASVTNLGSESSGGQVQP